MSHHTTAQAAANPDALAEFVFEVRRSQSEFDSKVKLTAEAVSAASRSVADLQKALDARATSLTHLRAEYLRLSQGAVDGDCPWKVLPQDPQQRSRTTPLPAFALHLIIGFAIFLAGVLAAPFVRSSFVNVGAKSVMAPASKIGTHHNRNS